LQAPLSTQRVLGVHGAVGATVATGGGFLSDGTFVAWPVHDTARLTEAFRRAVLRLFVRLALFDAEQAAGMRTCPTQGCMCTRPSGCPRTIAPSRPGSRSTRRGPPVTLQRFTYYRAANAVTYRSNKSDGPTAGTETVDPLEFLARVVVHIPDQGHVTTRYYGWDANRPRGMRGKAAAPRSIVPAPRLAPTEASRR